MKKSMSKIILILLVFTIFGCQRPADRIKLTSLGSPQEYVLKYDLNVASRVYKYHAGSDIKNLEIDFIKEYQGQVEHYPFNIALDSDKGLIIIDGSDGYISNGCRVIILGEHEQVINFDFKMPIQDSWYNLSHGSQIKEIELNKDQIHEFYVQVSSFDEDQGAIMCANYFSDDIDACKAPEDQLTFLVTFSFS